MSEMTEARLMQECFRWHWNTYPSQRGLFFRIKNEGTNRISGAIGKATGIIPGVADCCLLLPGGQAIFIEFKTPEGKFSKVQTDWGFKIASQGFHYFIIRSLTEFKDLCQKLVSS